jgi:hypothetical protein
MSSLVSCQATAKAYLWIHCSFGQWVLFFSVNVDMVIPIYIFLQMCDTIDRTNEANYLMDQQQIHSPYWVSKNILVTKNVFVIICIIPHSSLYRASLGSYKFRDYMRSRSSQHFRNKFNKLKMSPIKGL